MDTRGYLIREVGPTRKISHVAAELDDQSQLMHNEWSMATAAVLRLSGLLKFLKMRSQQLLHVRESGGVPGDREHLSGR